MAKPIIVLAGQSNAARLSNEIVQSLNAQYGAGEYVLVRVYDAGAPLTFARAGKTDWFNPGELRSELVTATSQALRNNPDGYVAGVIWLQGEGDTNAAGSPGAYDRMFVKLMNEFRMGVQEAASSATGVWAAPIVIAGLSSHAPAASYRDKWDDMRAVHFELDRDHVGIITVDPDRVASNNGVGTGQMFSDGLHYSDSFSQTLSDALVRAVVRGETAPAQSSNADTGSAAATANSMVGSPASDIFVVDHQNDTINEQSGGGRDTVFASVSFDLRDHSQHLENLTLTGTANIDAAGNGQNNVLRGNAGNNRLDGAFGNDLLIGGAGNDVFRDAAGEDTMTGGAGNDTFYVDHRGDVVNEGRNGGEDRVISSVSFELRLHSQDLEHLTLTGNANLTGVGNALNNTIRGNDGNNILNGAWGNDKLVGSGGRDTLRDSGGNDLLIGGPDGDRFVFINDWGQDTVRDFDPDQSGEFLDFSRDREINGFSDLMDNHAAQSGSDVVISDGRGNSVTLKNVDLDDLSANDFLF